MISASAGLPSSACAAKGNSNFDRILHRWPDCQLTSCLYFTSALGSRLRPKSQPRPVVAPVALLAMKLRSHPETSSLSRPRRWTNFLSRLSLHLLPNRRFACNSIRQSSPWPRPEEISDLRYKPTFDPAFDELPTLFDISPAANRKRKHRTLSIVHLLPNLSLAASLVERPHHRHAVDSISRLNECFGICSAGDDTPTVTELCIVPPTPRMSFRLNSKSSSSNLRRQANLRFLSKVHLPAKQEMSFPNPYSATN